MSALLEELVHENVRTLGAAISRRGATAADAQDAEDAVRMMLRSYEDLKLLWERYVSLLTTGLDVRKASEGLQAAITRFDEWLEGARQVETLIESVATRTGRSLGCAAKFRKVMEQVIAVRQSASASLEEFDDLPNLVDSAAISETRTLFEQGKYKDLGEILARRAAGKS